MEELTKILTFIWILALIGIAAMVVGIVAVVIFLISLLV